MAELNENVVDPNKVQKATELILQLQEDIANTTDSTKIKSWQSSIDNAKQRFGISDEALVPKNKPLPEPSGAVKELFPTAGGFGGLGSEPTGMPQDTKLEKVKKVGTQALDIIDLPVRKVRELFGTEEKAAEILEPIQNELARMKELDQIRTERGWTPEEQAEFQELNAETNKRVMASGAVKFSPELVTLFGGTVIKAGSRFVGNVAEQTFKNMSRALTNLSEEALEAVGFLGSGVKKMGKKLGKFSKKGSKGDFATKAIDGRDRAFSELGKKLDDFYKSPSFPEDEFVSAAIKNVEDIDVTPIVKQLAKARPKGKFAKEINDKIDEMIAELTENGTSMKMSAEDFLATRRNLDDFIGNAFEKEVANKFRVRMKPVANEMRKSIRNAAGRSGQKDLVKNIESMHEKLKAMEKMRFRYGMESENYIKALMSTDNITRKEALEQTRKLFNNDKRLAILDDAKLAKIAKEFNKGDFKTRGFAPRGGRPGSGFGFLGQFFGSPAALESARKSAKAGALTADALINQLGVTSAQAGAILSALKEMDAQSE